MSDKYILMKGDYALTELGTLTEAQELSHFMNCLHPGNAYTIVVEEAI